MARALWDDLDERRAALVNALASVHHTDALRWPSWVVSWAPRPMPECPRAPSTTALTATSMRPCTSSRLEGHDADNGQGNGRSHLGNQCVFVINPNDWQGPLSAGAYFGTI